MIALRLSLWSTLSTEQAVVIENRIGLFQLFINPSLGLWVNCAKMPTTNLTCGCFACKAHGSMRDISMNAFFDLSLSSKLFCFNCRGPNHTAQDYRRVIIRPALLLL